MKAHLTPTNWRLPAWIIGAILASCLGTELPPALASAGSWTRKADLPVLRVGAASAEVDGILYVAGGHTNAPYAPPDQTLFAYDPKADIWTPKTNMPTARVLAAASAVDGILHVIGGASRTDPLTVVAVVEAYDPRTDTWTTEAPMPTARADIAACTLDGLIYVIGGVVPGGFLSVVECYDPGTDQWTQKANLPVTAEVPVAQVVNGVIHVFVGNQTFTYDPETNTWTERANLPSDSLYSRASAAGTIGGVVYLFGGLMEFSTCGSAAALAYDPVQDQFTQLPPMPAPTGVAAHATIGGRIYIAGGTSGVQPDCANGVVHQSLWVFDPGSWTRKADLPVLRVGAASAEVDGILYVAGGHTNAPYAPPDRTLFAYDSTTDIWTPKTNMPTARVLAAASAADGILYVIGGASRTDPLTVVATVEAYDPLTDTWTRKASMPTARGAIAACALDGLIYVFGGVVPGGFLSVVECYDPRTDRWTRKANLPVTAEAPVAQVVNGLICAFVGNQTFTYDPETNTWTERANLPSDSLYSRASAAGTIGGVVYLFGGLMNSSTCGSAAALAYDPVQDQFTQLPPMPAPTGGAAYATIGGRIYIAGGTSGVPPDCADGVVHQSLWVYGPQSGDAPRFRSLACEGNNTVRLVWQAEPGHWYRVETTVNVANGPWESFTLSSGATIFATNAVVETTGAVPATDTARFFRVQQDD